MDNFLDFSKIIKKGDYDAVYRPNDDSYFLLKMILEDIDRSQTNKLIVEMGCGSGFVIGNIANNLKQNDHIYLALDINIDACNMTRKLSEYYKLGLDIINCNGCCGLNLSNKIDVFIFNPPYVPTEQYEVENAKIAVQQKQRRYIELFDQGLRGEEVDIISLSNLAHLKIKFILFWRRKWYGDYMEDPERSCGQNKRKWHYVLLCKIAENDLKKVGEFFVSKGFVFKILGKQQKYNEHQIVIKQFFFVTYSKRFRKTVVTPLYQ